METFNFTAWLKESLIKACLRGEFSREYVAIKCDELLTKNRFIEMDVEEVYFATQPQEIIQEEPTV